MVFKDVRKNEYPSVVDDFPIWAPGKSLRALSQMPSYPI